MPVFRIEIDQRGTETTTYEIEATSPEGAEQRISELISLGEEPEPKLIEFHADTNASEVDTSATREVPAPPQE